MSVPSAPSAPPVPRVDLQLVLTRPSGEARTVDLATRALVVAVVPPPRWGREAEVLAGVAAAAEAGADVVEVPADPRLLGPAAAQGDSPVTAQVETAAAARAALAAGASFVLVPHDHLDDVVGSAPDDDDDPVASLPTNGHALRPGGTADPSAPGRVVTVVATARAGRDAVAAEPTRPVALDVTVLSGADAVSEESLALAVGVRLVRTGDVRRTRRVVEVMAHLLEARR
jgi:hypothetical protein